MAINIVTESLATHSKMSATKKQESISETLNSNKFGFGTYEVKKSMMLSLINKNTDRDKNLLARKCACLISIIYVEFNGDMSLLDIACSAINQATGGSNKIDL